MFGWFSRNFLKEEGVQKLSMYTLSICISIVHLTILETHVPEHHHKHHAFVTGFLELHRNDREALHELLHPAIKGIKG